MDIQKPYDCMQIRNFRKEINKAPKDFYENLIFSKDSSGTL